jgi:hypothetical protein
MSSGTSGGILAEYFPCCRELAIVQATSGTNTGNAVNTHSGLAASKQTPGFGYKN